MVRLINARWRLPLAFLAAGLSAIVIEAATRRARRPLETTGGPLVAVLEDGALLRGGVRVYPLGPDLQLRWTRIGSRDGAGEPNWQFNGLSLRPDGAVFAVATLEEFYDGFDLRVTVHDTATGASLFSATDNSHPTTVWNGNEPDIPDLLRAEQANLDAEWQEWRKVDPDVARPIAQARFDDPASDGELFHGGWTNAGHCLLIGRSRLEITTDVYGPQVSDHAPWWGIAGPVAGGRWGWIERGHGTRPDIHAPVPQPPLAGPITLAGLQLSVGGVVQTDPALAAGVSAFAGPFA